MGQNRNGRKTRLKRRARLFFYDTVLTPVFFTLLRFRPVRAVLSGVLIWLLTSPLCRRFKFVSRSKENLRLSNLGFRSEEEVDRVFKAFVGYFVASMIDLFTSLDRVAENMRVALENGRMRDAEQRLIDFKHGPLLPICAGYHSISPFLPPVFSSLIGWKYHVAIKPQRSALLQKRLLKDLAPYASAIHMLGKSRADWRRLYIVAKSNQPVGAAIDQFSPSGIEVMFLGRKTRVPSLLVRLAQVSSRPLFVVHGERCRGGSYRIIVSDLFFPDENHENPLQDLAQRVMLYIEQQIHKAPERWIWNYRMWDKFRPESSGATRVATGK